MFEVSEFRDLRVILMGGRPSAVQIMRTVFGVAGISNVVAVADSREAIRLLQNERFSALFCDEHAEAVSQVPFAVAARRMAGILDPAIPIFLLCSGVRRGQVQEARDLGVTDILTRPVSAATVIRKLRTAFAKPRPFITASEFMGPDRRMKSNTSQAGEERRKAKS